MNAYLQRRQQTHPSSGHTLMELMLVVSLLTVAATILLPITTRAYARFRLRLMQDSLVRLMHEARSRALLEGRTYFLVFPDSRAHDKALVLIREDGSSVDSYTPPLDMSIRRHQPDDSWSAEIDSVAFYPDGTSDALELVLRNASNSACGIRLDPLTAKASLILESEVQL